MTETLTGEWLSLADAAKRLGLAVDTVRRRVKRGELQGRKLPTQTGYRWEVYLDGAYVDVQADPEPPMPRLDELVNLVRDLTTQNVQLAGQVGYLQGKLQDAEHKLALLEAPTEETLHAATISHAENKSAWWAFWRR
jgi:hypothetical protein